jgi:hypothetical protein
MWQIQLAFILYTVCRIFLSSLAPCDTLFLAHSVNLSPAAHFKTSQVYLIKFWIVQCSETLRYYSDGPGIDSGISSDTTDNRLHGPRVDTAPIKMSTRKVSRVKGGLCLRVMTSLNSSAECYENLGAETPGTLWATPGILRYCFTSKFQKHKRPCFKLCNSFSCNHENTYITPQ